MESRRRRNPDVEFPGGNPCETVIARGIRHHIGAKLDVRARPTAPDDIVRSGAPKLHDNAGNAVFPNILQSIVIRILPDEVADGEGTLLKIPSGDILARGERQNNTVGRSSVRICQRPVASLNGIAQRVGTWSHIAEGISTRGICLRGPGHIIPGAGDTVYSAPHHRYRDIIHARLTGFRNPVAITKDDRSGQTSSQQTIPIVQRQERRSIGHRGISVAIEGQRRIHRGNGIELSGERIRPNFHHVGGVSDAIEPVGAVCGGDLSVEKGNARAVIPFHHHVG